MSESVGDAEAVGVGMALEKTCALEARLRTAIQGTHPLADSLDQDPVAADREREALLNITCAPDHACLCTISWDFPGLLSVAPL